jgi:ribosomal protein S18 acetylase RimI-like enzyme
MSESRIRFAPLDKTHDRASFASGNEALDGWFRTRAGQDERRGVSRVFVAVDGSGVVGFYTLSMFSIALESVPPDLARKLPKYPDVPAALIGRLARASRARGTGIGELLVADALRRIVGVSRSIAAFAIVVDAIDDRAKAFYERLGFVPFASRSDRLFMLAETVAAGISLADQGR